MAFRKGEDGRYQCTGVHERTGARPQQPLDSGPKKKLGDRLSTSGDVGRKGHVLLLPWPAAPPSRAVPPSFRVHSPSRPACQLDSLLSFQAGTLFHILANCVQVERIWWKKPHVHMRACVRVPTLQPWQLPQEHCIDRKGWRTVSLSLCPDGLWVMSAALGLVP